MKFFATLSKKPDVEIISFPLGWAGLPDTFLTSSECRCGRIPQTTRANHFMKNA
jgi:hypothetical protein